MNTFEILKTINFYAVISVFNPSFWEKIAFKIFVTR